MKCSICGSDNPPGATTCRRCDGPLAGVAVPGAAAVDPSAERASAAASRPAAVPPRQGRQRGEVPREPPRLLVPKRERAAAGGPTAAPRQVPRPIETPASRATPSQPPLPVAAPRPRPPGDDVPISVHFDHTLIERAPKLGPPGAAPTEPLRVAPAAPDSDDATAVDARPTDQFEPVDTDPDATNMDISPPLALQQHDTDPGGLPDFDDGPTLVDQPQRREAELASRAPVPEEIDVTDPDATPVQGADRSDAPVTVAVHRQITLATLARRAVAGFIDLTMVALLAGVHLVVALARLPETIGPARGTGFDRLIDATLVYVDATLPTAVVFVVLLVLYQTVFVALLGQTPGQVLLGLHVISRRHRKVGFGAALARGVFMAVGLLVLGLGWSIILLSRRRRALHDLITSTYVGRAIDEVLTSTPEPELETPPADGDPATLLAP